MSGRIQQDQKIEEWIKNKLSDCPQLLVDYMLSISETKTSMTRKAYLGYLFQYVQFMNEQGVDILQVKPMHIDRFRKYIKNNNGHTNGSNIINAKLSSIISFYDFLKENGFVDSNPCDNKKKLKVSMNSQVVYMSDSEIKHVKKTILKGDNRKSQKYKNRDLCIFILGCSTGLRVSAIVNIDVDDIDFDKKEIRVIEKGNKERNVYIGDNTINAIKVWMRDRERLIKNKTERALFISQKQGRMSQRAVEQMIHKVTQDLGKHITPHKMRSTCGMKLYNKTGDIYLTATQLGHANIKNTMIYAKATEDRRREAASILDK